MRRRILLLATTTGYQTRAFEGAAKDLDVELVYATDRCHVLDDPWRDRAIPVRFYDEAASLTAILDAARARPIHGVLAVGDRPVVLAGRVAQALGLPGNPPDAALIARSKPRLRDCLRARGLLAPEFMVLPLSSDPREASDRIGYPMIIKPAALSGSRGVMRVDDEAQLAIGWTRLRALLHGEEVRQERNQDHAVGVIESFIPGREFAVEAVLTNGAVQPLAVFDKPDPLDGPFFEETIYVTPSRAASEVQRAIQQAIASAADVIGLRYGPIHAECRVNDRGVFVLEVAARPIGGLCARALRFVGGHDTIGLEELLLRHALGDSVSGWRREDPASGVMMIPIPRRGIYRHVTGVEAARAVPHVDDVKITAKVDQVLVPLPEGSSYLGFIFARASTADEVDHALRAAHRHLQFTIDSEIPVVQLAHG